MLYELLTGRQAFAGETTSDTIAAILEREPDWAALPAATPPKVRRLLRRTLEKNATLRLRDIGDARIELVSSADDEQPARESRRLGLTRWFAYLIAAATAGVAIAMALLWRPAAPPTFRQLTFRRGAVQTARFTADGKSLVYRQPGTADGRKSSPAASTVPNRDRSDGLRARSCLRSRRQTKSRSRWGVVGTVLSESLPEAAPAGRLPGRRWPEALPVNLQQTSSLPTGRPTESSPWSEGKGGAIALNPRWDRWFTRMIS